MTFGYIYKIVFTNGKHYIGLTTTSIEQRQNQHKQTAKKGDMHCLYNALRKYDMVDTFELIEIDTADTIGELCEKEIGYIIEYNSYYMNGNGYNMTHGGEGTNGYVFTEVDKQKMGESQKKRFENPEEIQKNSERGKKYWEDHPEAKEEMSKIKKKYYADNPEVIEKISETSKKQWETPDARKQMSEIKKKYYEDNPEAKRKAIDGQGKNKPFDIFTNDGAFVKTFTYQFEAKEYLRKEHHITSTIKIDEVLCGRRKSSAGFVFKYK